MRTAVVPVLRWWWDSSFLASYRSESVTDTRVLLVRHASAVVSGADPPGAWPLSGAGRLSASALGQRLATRFPTALRTIVSSGERKAIETAAEIAESSPAIDGRLGEVSKPWYPNAPDHEADAVQYLRGAEVAGWEHQHEATTRFGAALAEVADPFVAVVTHGTVMSLWLAVVVEDFDPVSFWLDLRFPDAHILQRSDDADLRWTIERI